MSESEQHEEVLREIINKYRKKGYKVIDLERKCPDGIAVRIVNGKIELNAIEILSSQYHIKKGWRNSWTYRSKISIYHMFDNLIIEVFRKGQKHRVSKIMELRKNVSK